MATAKKAASGEITVMEVSTGLFEVCLLGTSPLICNRMSEKAKRELLFPSAPLTSADKKSRLKHQPIKEYQASPYRLRTSDALIGMMSTAFKGAIRTTALDIPGASKAQIGRLVYVEGEMVPVFGVPKLFMSVVRSADMNRTPDVRTRAILPEWACSLRVRYTTPLIKERTLINLIVAAGMNVGVGDWRPEKGSGTYGQFRIVSPKDPDYVRITSKQGREAQADALENPECYDEETAELLSWFETEVKTRGLEAQLETHEEGAL